MRTQTETIDSKASPTRHWGTRTLRSIHTLIKTCPKGRGSDTLESYSFGSVISSPFLSTEFPAKIKPSLEYQKTDSAGRCSMTSTALLSLWREINYHVQSTEDTQALIGRLIAVSLRQTDKLTFCRSIYHLRWENNLVSLQKWLPCRGMSCENSQSFTIVIVSGTEKRRQPEGNMLN